MAFTRRCPYCGSNGLKRHVNTQAISYTNNCKLFSEVHICNDCNNPIFVLSKTGEYAPELIEYLPTPNYADLSEFPEIIKILSPNCYKFYIQAVKLYDTNMKDLAVAGLRISLEWLAFDYLIIVKEKAPEDIESKTFLAEKIKLMELNKNEKLCADVVRLLGNDYVHIVKEQDFSIEEAFGALEMLIMFLNSELLIKKDQFDERIQAYYELKKQKQEAQRKKEKEKANTDNGKQHSLPNAARDGLTAEKQVTEKAKKEIKDEVSDL